MTGLPKHLAGGAITVTEETPGTYRIKGSTTGTVESWADMRVTGHLDAGTYTMEASDLPLGPDSWVIATQLTLTPDDGGGEKVEFGPANYGTKTLPAGTFASNTFINTKGDVDALITPRLYRLD